MFEYDEGLEHFLGEGEAQWFEVWVDMTPADGVLGLIIRGSEYEHIHLDENTTEISHVEWNCSGFITGSPFSGDAMRSLLGG